MRRVKWRQQGSKGTTVEQHLITALSENATADVEAIAHTFAKDFLAPAQKHGTRHAWSYYRRYIGAYC